MAIKANSESKFEIENKSLRKELETLQSKNLDLEKEFSLIKNESSVNIQKLQDEIFELKNSFISEKQISFDKGFEKGKEMSNYRIEIHPYQAISQNKKFFGNEDVLNVGYKYMMFINNVPTPYSHIEIFETITKKEINEEKVNLLISKISDITTAIPNGNIKLVGSIAEFGKNILNFRK